jgi:putative ABC transport system permease protein
MFETLSQDIRYALRGLRRTPGFTLAALITLTLGIGATTAIFSVVYGVLLRPLPFPAGDRLVMLPLEPTRPGGFSFGGAVSPASYLDWQSRSGAVGELAAFTQRAFTVTGHGEPELLTAAAVTSAFFETLQVQAAIGRAFTAGDGDAGDGDVVVLSDRLWRQRFAADAAIVGRAVTLDGRPFVVLGVMREGFTFPEEVLGPPGRFRSIQRVDLWTLFVPRAGERGNAFLRMLARLPPDGSVAQAQADLTRAGRAMAAEEGRPFDFAPVVTPLQRYIVGDVERLLLMFFGAVAFLLLIACANVANLLVARAAARQKEVAMRSALGAGRGRLVRQFLTESALLGVLGGLGGLLLAAAGLRAFVELIPRGSVPRLDEITIDLTVLLFTLLVSIGAGLLFGLAPVLHTRRTGIVTAMKGVGSAQTARLGLLNVLVAAEVACAVVLLAGAGLLIASFLRLAAVDPGFGRGNLMSASVRLPESSYSTGAQMIAFHSRVLDQISLARGVTSAAAVNWLPFGGNLLSGDVLVEAGRPAEPLSVAKLAVSAGYFRTMEIPLVSGRFFTDADGERSQVVVIVTDRVANRFWPGRNPLGQRLKLGFGRADDQPWASVVGVVKDVRQTALSDAAMPSVYMPLAQAPRPFLLSEMTYVARSDGDPVNIAPAFRAAVRAIDPNLPISRMAPLDALIALSVAEPRFRGVLFGAFAVVALALVATGILGVLAFSVTRRTKEIGVRVALGAAPGTIARLVVWQGLAVTVVGMLAGLGGALALTRLLRNLLFDIEPTDPGVFALVGLSLIAVALVASYLPAYRAARVDPIVALSQE